MKQQMFQTALKADNPSEINLSKYIEHNQHDQTCQLPCTSITIFVSLGFIFILTGIASLVSNFQQDTVEIQLYQQNSTLYTLSTYLSFGSENTLMVYLKIQKLSQFDHFVSNDQTNYFESNSKNCGNYKFNKDLGKLISNSNQTLDPNAQAVPCGYFPAMFPQGTISISINNNNSVSLDQRDLTYFSYQISQQKINSNAWVNQSDPFFQSWMLQNAMITTTKLVGKLSGSFQGDFQLSIQLKNPLPSNIGKAWIILTTSKAFGSSNIPFCVINFCQSGLLFIFTLAIFLYNKLLNKDLKRNKIEVQQLQLQSQSENISVKTGNL